MYLSLFFTFVKIGLFSFGGGYAILAMIRQETVVYHHWLTASQFTDIVAISQMTPGPIAINAATFVGYSQAGIPGALLCTFGVILPSLVLMTLITLTYLRLRKQVWFQQVFQKLRWLTLGLIGAAVILLSKGVFKDWFSVLVFALALIVYWRFKPNPLYIMLGAAVIGIFLG
jgi:chromate transporter